MSDKKHPIWHISRNPQSGNPLSQQRAAAIWSPISEASWTRGRIEKQALSRLCALTNSQIGQLLNREPNLRFRDEVYVIYDATHVQMSNLVRVELRLQGDDGWKDWSAAIKREPLYTRTVYPQVATMGEEVTLKCGETYVKCTVDTPKIVSQGLGGLRVLLDLRPRSHHRHNDDAFEEAIAFASARRIE